MQRGPPFPCPPGRNPLLAPAGVEQANVARLRPSTSPILPATDSHSTEAWVQNQSNNAKSPVSENPLSHSLSFNAAQAHDAAKCELRCALPGVSKMPKNVEVALPLTDSLLCGRDTTSHNGRPLHALAKPNRDASDQAAALAMARG